LQSMSKGKVTRIAVITNIIPVYREGFYNRIFSRRDIDVRVYCQERIPGLNIESVHGKFQHRITLLRYLTMKRERLTWRFIPWRKVMVESDVIFIQGNPRLLSDALFATYLRILRKNVVLWTMVHSSRGNKLAEWIRILWLRIFRYIFVYTDVEVECLIKRGFKRKVILGMNNGLDQDEIDKAILQWPTSRLQGWRKAKGLEERTLVLSCARLESKNRFDLVVKALPRLVKHFPNLIWCVIGAGPEMDNLKSMATAAGLAEHVHFVGELICETELAPWFLSSEIFVHPEAVGLSIIHSFGYGLPAIIGDNPNAHGPENSAFEKGRTGWAFHEKNASHLANTIIGLLNENDVRRNMKSHVYKIAREKFNVDVMVERFVQIAKRAESD
jgi:glycosyltransferase involved in cell wall biosynthesis